MNVKNIHVEVTADEIKKRFRKPNDMLQNDYDKAVFDKMLKKFSRKVVKSAHLKKYTEHQYYEKPSKKEHDRVTRVLFIVKKEKELGKEFNQRGE